MEWTRPPILYKYHIGGIHLPDVLENNRLFLCPYHKLDDPWDCRFRFSDEIEEQAMRVGSERLWQDLRNHNVPQASISHDEFFERQRALLLSERGRHDFYEDVLYPGLNWSVSCFADDPLNMRMWSHYANSHSGVCMEFDFAASPVLESKLFPVVYVSQIPRVHSFEDLVPSLFTKTEAWKDQREWRVVGGGDQQFVHFEASCLRAINSGAQCTKETQELALIC